MPQTIPEELTKLRHIFGDETCQERHRWMVLGTTVVLDEHIQHVRAKFLAVKARMGLAGCEMKWERTNKKLLDRYKRMADVAFFLIKKGVMQFHAMLICMDVVDHEKYNEGIPDLSYSRFFHHLLMKYLRIYPAENKYYVLFDERTSTVPMRPFQDPANFAAKRDYGIDHWPFRRLKYQNSKSDVLFEINDLLLGAIGFLRNGKHKVEPTKRCPKAELAIYIRRASPAHSFWQDTADHSAGFTLWALRFDGKKGKNAFRNRANFKRKHQAGKAAPQAKGALRHRSPAWPGC